MNIRLKLEKIRAGIHSKVLVYFIFFLMAAGCGTSKYFENVPLLKKEETAAPEINKDGQTMKDRPIFVCPGDINVVYEKLGEVRLEEFGFSGKEVLASKLNEKGRSVGAQAVINVQYDTGQSKTRRGYGELGGNDYDMGYTSWCSGMAITFVEEHNAMGLIVCDITKENKEWFGFKKKHNGTIVVHVESGSTAEGADIKVEDLIMEFNGEKIESKKHLKQLIKTHAGNEVKLSILREGEIKTATVKVPVYENQEVASYTPPPTANKVTISSERKVTRPRTSDTKSADVHNEVGDLYLRKGMYNDAMEEYLKAIDADPYNAISHFNLSIVYEKMGMVKEADEEFALYKKLKPKRK
ncbi:MAG: PDZ domain-containing protein [Candidatus Brocadiaceae bacterium]|nr:PDZ domain-containing protein [Candidatus Brocadiaceae bacterium]